MAMAWPPALDKKSAIVLRAVPVQYVGAPAQPTPEECIFAYCGGASKRGVR